MCLPQDLLSFFTPHLCPVAGSGLCLRSHKQTGMLSYSTDKPIAVGLPRADMEVYNSAGFWGCGLRASAAV